MKEQFFNPIFAKLLPVPVKMVVFYTLF